MSGFDGIASRIGTGDGAGIGVSENDAALIFKEVVSGGGITAIVDELVDGVLHGAEGGASFNGLVESISALEGSLIERADKLLNDSELVAAPGSSIVDGIESIGKLIAGGIDERDLLTRRPFESDRSVAELKNNIITVDGGSAYRDVMHLNLISDGIVKDQIIAVAVGIIVNDIGTRGIDGIIARLSVDGDIGKVGLNEIITRRALNGIVLDGGIEGIGELIAAGADERDLLTRRALESNGSIPELKNNIITVDRGTADCDVMHLDLIADGVIKDEIIAVAVGIIIDDIGTRGIDSITASPAVDGDIGPSTDDEIITDAAVEHGTVIGRTDGIIPLTRINGNIPSCGSADDGIIAAESIDDGKGARIANDIIARGPLDGGRITSIGDGTVIVCGSISLEDMNLLISGAFDGQESV